MFKMFKSPLANQFKMFKQFQEFKDEGLNS